MICSPLVTLGFCPLRKEVLLKKLKMTRIGSTYRFMTNEFHFVPICVETMGVWGPNGTNSLKKLEN